ncbi:MAG: hydroxysqualene dehydroxylase HpnE [Planctomycetota bacterium]
MIKSTNAIVIGGGFAGLAAAWRLGGLGIETLLFERRKTLGGRASSFLDPATNCEIDNGQHIVLGACTELLQFLGELEKNSSIAWRDCYYLWSGDRGGRFVRLAPSAFLPPSLQFFPAFLQYSHLTIAERARALAILLKVKRMDERELQRLESVTFGRWLEEQRAPKKLISRFFEPVVIGALNESPDRASARAALWILKNGFLTSAANARLGVPSIPLSDFFDHSSQEKYTKHKVTIRIGEDVAEINRFDSGDWTVRTNAGSYTSKIVILAIPWHALTRVLPPNISTAIPGLAEFTKVNPSPIQTVHYFFDRDVALPIPEVAILERTAHWAFDRYQATGREADRGHIAVVVSAAHELSKKTREEIEIILLADLREVFPSLQKREPRRMLMTTEWSATYSAAPGVEMLRIPEATPCRGLFVAGDTCRTGWPATMESAVRSGNAAAGAAHRYIQSIIQ